MPAQLTTRILGITLLSLLASACSGPGSRSEAPPPPVINRGQTVPQPGTGAPSSTPVPAAASITLQGSATIDQTEPLPPTAKLVVSLQAASASGSSGARLAQQTVFVKTGAATPFALQIDSSKVVSGRSYVLNGQVLLGGRLMYLTQQPLPVDPAAGDQGDLRLELMPVR